MSDEIIRAVIESSQRTYPDTQFMFVCSENQINRDGGYTGLSTEQFSQRTRELDNEKVWLCRDHCGPGFFYRSVEECMKTIEDDIANNFDLIHIDTCFISSIDEKLRVTHRMMDHAKDHDPSVQFEIGTEVNSVQNRLQPVQLRAYLGSVCRTAVPFFYVLETGAVVLGYNNSSVFDPCEESLEIIQKTGVRCKEHNADYLLRDQIKLRHGRIQALNVAPQFGVLQTAVTLAECVIYGVNADDFKNVVYESGKWKKWKVDSFYHNPDQAVLLGGHYLFQSPEYQRLLDELRKHTDISRVIVDKAKALIHHYVRGYHGH